ncbi:MAG: IS1380 family transposase [Candidatus Nanopelagicales bacterium]
MQLSHGRPVGSVRFDDPNLVSSAGLVPLMALARSTGLRALADAHLSVPTDKGSNAGLKVSSLVAGMAAGADSIDDMAVLRHGGMGRVFDGAYAPSTLGSFLRAFTFGHVRQLDAVASRVLGRLAEQTPVVAGIDDLALVDLDDTIVEVHGHGKHGAGFGYTGVRGLNAMAATLTTATSAPVIVATRLRKGSANSARGAARITADALATVRGLRSKAATGMVLVRADSAYYGRPTVLAAARGGAQVSVTVRQDARIRAAIEAIPDDAWTTIDYPHAVFDEVTGAWISVAEVAEIPFTAFASAKKSEQVPGRLVVRRIPDLNPPADPAQAHLFAVFRFHAFFTTSDLPTVEADKVHRQHAIIEQVFADLKGSALAHLPSGSFAANSAWLVLAAVASSLTRAIGTIAGGPHAKATTASLRRRIISVPARIASSARRLTLHLPTAWPWQDAWQRIFDTTHGPPAPATT